MGNVFANLRRMTPLKAPILPKKSKNSPYYLSEPVYLDTETSKIYDEKEEKGAGWMYQWALSFMDEYDWGRTPSDLIRALQRIDDANHLTEQGVTCVLYIHNLSYDICYLIDWLEDYYQCKGEYLALAPHRFLNYKIACWEFRDSYRLANRSLAKWAKDLNIPIRKKEGMIDYDIIRYPTTKLTRKDWVYMIYDVATLKACIEAEAGAEHDTINSIPLTSTGYVRRDARKEYRTKGEYSVNYREFKNGEMDAPLFKRMHAAFAGGLTHGNRFHAEETVEGDIDHDDFISHYPTQEMTKYAPRGKFLLLYEWRKGRGLFTQKDVDKWTETHCLLMDILIADPRVHPEVTLPYLSVSKCFLGRSDKYGWHTIEDNGRILQAKGVTVISVTELDFKWIIRQYDFTALRILRVYAAEKGRFPEWLRRTVMKYYKPKCELKPVVKDMEKHPDNYSDADIANTMQSYQKAKNKLNGVYGMTATNPVRPDIILTEGGNWSIAIPRTEEEIGAKLEKFYGSRNSFMTYALGVWTTAHARDELMEMVELVGYDHFLYADTDSIFYLATDEIREKIRQWNEQKAKEAEELGAYYQVGNNMNYMHQFDTEHAHIRAFRFLHAKAYAFIDSEGRLNCTIAGVSDRGRNGNTRVKELGSIDRLRHGTVFHDCGGTRAAYLYAPPHIENINGHAVPIASSCLILPTEKTLNGLISKDEYSFVFELKEDDIDIEE